MNKTMKPHETVTQYQLLEKDVICLYSHYIKRYSEYLKPGFETNFSLSVGEQLLNSHSLSRKQAEIIVRLHDILEERVIRHAKSR